MKDLNELRKALDYESDMLIACRNRMCVCDTEDELFRMFAYLHVRAYNLFNLNKMRLNCKELK